MTTPGILCRKHRKKKEEEEERENNAQIADEPCPDEEFDVATPSEETKSICTVDFYPIKYKFDIGQEEFKIYLPKQ